jgi:hypothetical protein
MSQYLTFAELDTAIQNKMGETAPDESIRLEAINTTVLDLMAEYDIKSAKREKVISVIPDGAKNTLSTTLTITDYKSPADLRYSDVTLNDEEFTLVDDDLFTTHIGQGVRLNEYSIDYADGEEFIKINTARDEDEATSFRFVYYTSFTAMSDAGAFQKDLTNVATDKLLLPRRFKSLIVVKAIQYLSPIALGVDSEIPLRRLDKQEKEEKEKLGLDIASKPKQATRKLKIHSPY